MAKAAGQKLKILHIMNMLLKLSDEEHPLSVREIISRLENLGITAERKSIYDDIESLRSFGMDIISVRSPKTGYYIGKRDFELPELKLLVDSVQSSKFITHKKTLSLIRKIERLASDYEAGLLHRQVYVRDRVKSMNESVYYNVDELSAAITNDHPVRFHYYEYTLSKERRFRRNGEIYEVSPFSLIWDNENYYLLAWDQQAEMMKHYRVDKMAGIEPAEGKRLGKDVFRQMDMGAYSRMVFEMFTGEEQIVRLRFADHLAGAVIDRFGKDISLVPEDEGHFAVDVPVVVSPRFYGWLFGFGRDAEVLSPQTIRNDMRRHIQQLAELYK